MSPIYLLKQLRGLNLLRIKPRGALNIRVVSFHSAEDDGESRLTPQWYQKAFLKLQKWTHMLKNLDMIDGKLVDVTQNKRIYDDKLEKKMHLFKAVARVLVGHPSMLQSIRDNVMSLHPREFKNAPPFLFSKPAERQPMVVERLSQIVNYLNVSVQQRKEVRLTMCRQVTRYQVWVTTLEEILKRLKSEIDGTRDNCSSKKLMLAKQMVCNCLKILDSVLSFDPASTSWMRFVPKKDRMDRMDRIPSNDPPPYTWEDVVQMFDDLINCLDKEKDFFVHLEKVEAMKEGLYHIRSFSIDKNAGYKENIHNEYSVQKKLTKSLGYTSRCLYTLLLYYLFDMVSDPQVEICGAVYQRCRGHKFYLCMGKILTSTEEKVLQNGMQQLDTALKLFKFVWDSARMKGDLEVQGHLFCVGANNRLLKYRGNSFFLHDLHL